MVTSPSIRFASSKSVSAALVPSPVFSITTALNTATPHTPRHGRLDAGHPRLDRLHSSKDVDARDKPGHDDFAIRIPVSGGRHCRARHRLLHDWQVDDCGKDAEQNRKPPDQVIRTGALEGDAADQHAKK